MRQLSLIYKINIVYCIKVSAISNVYTANHNKNQSSYQIIYKVDQANHTMKCTQKNLSNKDETPNHEEKGQKHMFLTTRPI